MVVTTHDSPRMTAQSENQLPFLAEAQRHRAVAASVSELVYYSTYIKQ